MNRQLGERGKTEAPGPGSAGSSNRAPFSTASNRAKATAACAAPSTVREPEDTTITSQSSATKGPKLLV